MGALTEPSPPAADDASLRGDRCDVRKRCSATSGAAGAELRRDDVGVAPLEKRLVESVDATGRGAWWA